QPRMPLPDPNVHPTPAYLPSIHPIPLDDSSSIGNRNISSQSAFIPSLLVCNPQSLTNCFDDFKKVINDKQPDIAVVSETWFSENKPASDYNIDGYKMYNDDREIRRGGGVAVYVKGDLESVEAQVKAPEELECVWVELGDYVMVCGIYHPPSAPTAPLLMDQIVNTVLDIRNRSPGICTIIAGDFNNLHHERLYSSLGLENLVKEPTHANSVIDLVLTDKPTAFVNPVLLPPIGKSRHHCVYVRPEPFMTDDANITSTLSQLKV
ncbi:unnamed protein product, partial [Meganyctiphanes norvegica]